MKSSSFISKLPIVSVNEGEQIKTIQSLVVSRASKKVEHFTVNGGSGSIVPLMLAFKDVIGIGNDYVVVQSADTIKKLYDNNEFIAAAEEGVVLIGASVMTTAGEFLEKVADYVVDEKTGVIATLTLCNDQEIAGDKLVSISAKFIVVELSGAAPEAPAEEAPKAELDENIAFLAGKVVNSEVASGDGKFTIKAGTVLTEKLIAEAEKRDMLLQLTMAV